MENVQVLPQPVQMIDPAEAAELVRRAAAARGVGAGASPRETGGLVLDLTGSGEPEQLVWGTFGKQEGLLALFRGGRLLATVDKELGEIRRVQPLALPGLSHFAVMVDDQVDEMVGAFFKELRRRIFVWDGRGLRQVYVGTLEGEQYVHARWENPRGHNVWRLRRTVGEVTVGDGRLIELTRVEQLEAPGAPEGPLPGPGAFRLVSERSSLRRSVWNSRLRRFEVE